MEDLLEGDPGPAIRGISIHLALVVHQLDDRLKAELRGGQGIVEALLDKAVEASDQSALALEDLLLDAQDLVEDHAVHLALELAVLLESELLPALLFVPVDERLEPLPEDLRGLA